MAIYTIQTPFDITPAYNPIKYVYDSTNKNAQGFKYVFDIYESGTLNKIAEYRVFPRFNDGFGEIDLSKLLQNKVTFDFDPATADAVAATNSYYKYDLKVGEEYVVTYNYTASLVDNGGNVKITPIVAHTFNVGDQIVLNAGTTNSAISGLWTVIAITGTTDFTINAFFINVADPTENGSVNYADNRKTITRDITSADSKYVFNGVKKWSEFNSYNDISVINQFLTDQPQYFKVNREQDIYMNILNNFDTTGLLYFKNSDGDEFTKPVDQNALINQVGVALHNVGALTLLSGTFPLEKPTTTYYEVTYCDASLNPLSNTFVYFMDRTCQIEEFEVVFLDRMGSFNNYAFTLRSYERGTVKKDTYKRDVLGYTTDADGWSYNSYDYGTRVINPTVEKTIELNTNWMTKDEDNYFQELITSPQVYIKIEGVYYACVVQDTNFEVARQKNKNLVRHSITVMLSNNDTING